MDEISKKLQKVRKRMAAAESRRDGRYPVRLIAVSKRQPVLAIAAAHDAGCVDFGENYVQELAEKAHTLQSTAPLKWHFIGHLQRNKVKALLAAGPVLIHGVDSAQLLSELDKRTAALEREAIAVLIQVNISAETSKRGCRPEELAALVELAVSLEGVQLRGLMTMPPAGDPERGRTCFRTLRTLAEGIGRSTVPELSMGMSHDFEDAIEEGATLIRVGTAIFGARGATAH